MSVSLVQNFYKETITTPWTTGLGNFYVSTKPTVEEGFLVVSPNSDGLREIVAYTATGTDGGGDYVTVSERGLGGTTEQAHGATEKVYMNITAEHIAQIKQAIEDISNDGALPATTTVRGVSKLSVAAADPAEPIVVGVNDPRIPSTDVTAALEGTVGIPNTDNKFVSEDNKSDATTDQEQTTQNSSVEIGEADTTLRKRTLAQSFIPTHTKMRGVSLYKSANTGVFIGSILVELRPDNAGSPDASVLATKTITNGAWNNTPVGEFSVDFTTEYGSLVVGDTYWIVITPSTADDAKHPNLGSNSAGGYANGQVKYYNVTDGWSLAVTIDLYFKTLQGLVGQVIQTDSLGKIPKSFFDTSKMPLPVFEQTLGLSAAESTASSEFTCGSSSDGTVLYLINQSSTKILHRYQKDSLTGMFKLTHTVTPAISMSSGDFGGIVQIGDYIYLLTGGSSTIFCSRLLASDLTGETVITMPAITSTSNVIAWTDGTYIYVTSNNTSTISRKLSFASATVLQEDSTTSITSLFTSFNNGVSSFHDGTNTYIIGDSTTGYATIKKLSNINGSAFTSTTYNTPRISDQTNLSIGINIDTRMYLGYLYEVEDASALVATGIKLIPITKP